MSFLALAMSKTVKTSICFRTAPTAQEVLSKHMKEMKARLDWNWDLPVDCEAINENRVSLLCGRLAEALEEDEDAGRLRVVQPGVVAADDVVEQDVDVGRLVRVERCDDLVRVRDDVTLGCHQLEDEADLNDLGLVEGRGGSGGRGSRTAAGRDIIVVDGGCGLLSARVGNMALVYGAAGWILLLLVRRCGYGGELLLLVLVRWLRGAVAATHGSIFLG